MQQLLAVDYLLGHQPKRETNFLFTIKHLAMVAPMFERFVVEKDNSLDWGLTLINQTREGHAFKDVMGKDPSFAAAIGEVSVYLNSKSNRKNYLVSKNLAEVLQEVPPNIKASYLPEEMTAYFEIPNLFDEDGDEIAYLIVSVHTVGNIKSIFAFYQVKNSDQIGHINFVFSDSSMKIKDAVESDTRHGIRHYGPMGDNKGKSYSKVVSQWLLTLCNAIVYATGSDKEYKEEINTFAPQIKKQNIQKKIYSSQPFVRLGEDVRRVILNRGTRETTVRGHFRWQPYGPEREQVKLIFIDEHSRTIEDHE